MDKIQKVQGREKEIALSYSNYFYKKMARNK